MENGERIVIVSSWVVQRKWSSFCVVLNIRIVLFFTFALIFLNSLLRSRITRIQQSTPVVCDRRRMTKIKFKKKKTINRTTESVASTLQSSGEDALTWTRRIYTRYPQPIWKLCGLPRSNRSESSSSSRTDWRARPRVRPREVSGPDRTACWTNTRFGNRINTRTRAKTTGRPCRKRLERTPNRWTSAITTQNAFLFRFETCISYGHDVIIDIIDFISSAYCRTDWVA